MFRERVVEGGIPPAIAVAPIGWAAALLCGLAIFFTAYNALYTSGAMGALAVAGFAALWLIILFRFRDGIAATLGRFASLLGKISLRAWMALCLLIGLALRVGLGLVFAPQSASDFRVYEMIGRRLAFTGIFMTQGSKAFWPPGMPFFLVPFYRLLGDHPWIPLAASSALFIATTFVVFAFARWRYGDAAARLATVLLAIWPSSILLSPFAAKELLLLPLVPGCVFAYLKSKSGGRLFGAALSGVLAGCAALTHPAFLLFPSVFAAADVIAGSISMQALKRLAACVIFFVLTIAPWTLRNYIVLDAFVPIATNGGEVLYQTNNDFATGQWIRSDVTKFGADEVTSDRAARREAVRWIGRHPVQFAVLSMRRLGYFLSADRIGAYFFFERGLGNTGLVYRTAAAISELYWFAILSLLAVAALRRFQRDDAILPLTFAYGAIIDAIVEGHANHHIAYLGILAVWVASLIPSAERWPREAEASPR